MTLDELSIIIGLSRQIVQKGGEQMRKKLKLTRIEKGYKDVEVFADKLDISASYYYKIEQGIRRPNVDLAKKMADVLSSTVDDLFFNQELDTSSKVEKQIV